MQAMQRVRIERCELFPIDAIQAGQAHVVFRVELHIQVHRLDESKRIELGARMETLDRPAVAVAMLTDEFERARAALQMRLRKRRTAEA